MPQPPKLPGEEVRKALEARLMRYDRGPFQEMLADAVSVKPSLTSWRKMAAKDPEKYTRAVTQLAKTAGFAEKTESVKVTGTIEELVTVLIARHGEDNARTVLTSMGLPANLVKSSENVIEGETIPVDPEATKDAHNDSEAISGS